MMTPYDWQESMAHRAQFVEGRLASGIPVAAASTPEGILIATYRTHITKLFEIYDRLVYSAIGQQSDIEAIRVAAVDFCHQEGFRRSEEDVTIQRTVTQISAAIKQSFGDFRTVPAVARNLFAEVNESPDQDRFYILDFDGDYAVHQNNAMLAGTPEAVAVMREAIAGVEFSKIKTIDALAQLREAVIKGMDPQGSEAAESRLPELCFEAAIISRDSTKNRRFRFLESPEL